MTTPKLPRDRIEDGTFPEEHHVNNLKESARLEESGASMTVLIIPWKADFAGFVDPNLKLHRVNHRMHDQFT